MNTQLFSVIAQVLAKAESFVSGQVVEIDIPQEQIEAGGLKLNISASVKVQKA